MSVPSDSGFSIALLGGGTVGAAVARGLVSRYEEWGIDIAGIAVRDVAKAEAAGLGKIAPLTTDPLALAGSDVDLVVELMGGLDPALPVVETALKAGRPVVTANKLLLANFGARLESLARASGAALRFESAVAAGVPVIGVLARDMAANEITSIKGIINGTTNYILTSMASAIFEPSRMSVNIDSPKTACPRLTKYKPATSRPSSQTSALCAWPR